MPNFSLVFYAFCFQHFSILKKNINSEKYNLLFFQNVIVLINHDVNYLLHSEYNLKIYNDYLKKYMKQFKMFQSGEQLGPLNPLRYFSGPITTKGFNFRII